MLRCPGGEDDGESIGDNGLAIGISFGLSWKNFGLRICINSDVGKSSGAGGGLNFKLSFHLWPINNEHSFYLFITLPHSVYITPCFNPWNSPVNLSGNLTL